MTRHLQTLAFVTVFALSFTALGRAQEPAATQPSKAAAPVQPQQSLMLTPLKLQIVISRYQGD